MEHPAPSCADPLLPRGSQGNSFAWGAPSGLSTATTAEAEQDMAQARIRNNP
ncbi:hypothetical protein MNEG_12739, partial [Monoraphidium neglectum]